MKTAQFYGCSDDLVEISGISGADEFGVYTGGLTVAMFRVSAEGRAMDVIAIYGCGNGTWGFGVAASEEEVGLPDWPVRVKQSDDCGYSVGLEIDVPDEAVVQQLETYSARRK